MAVTVLDAGSSTGKPLLSGSSHSRGREQAINQSINPDQPSDNKYYGQN